LSRTTLAALASGITIGIAIAWIDSRPNWDDTGVTAGALVLTSAMLGALAPRRPWLWALGVGLWIPLYGILHARNYGTLLVLAFTFAGAYIGAGLRRAFAPPPASDGSRIQVT
jgi:hypothetical protein